MTKISKEEVLKIASISNIFLSEAEVDDVQRELEAVLSYAERVMMVQQDVQDTMLVPMNVFREDVAQSTDSKRILAGAPEVTGDYFVVPLILDQQS